GKNRRGREVFSPATPDTTTEPVCNHPDQMAELARYIADEMNRNLLHPAVQKLKNRLNYDAAQETRQWMSCRGTHHWVHIIPTDDSGLEHCGSDGDMGGKSGAEQGVGSQAKNTKRIQ
ncbi:Uncharacterized protein ALO40_03271, partial [Pseudomonas syringae pv. viburni]